MSLVEQHLKLVPATSFNSSRYEDSTSVQLCPLSVIQGPASRASLVSTQKWSRYVHPEGKQYFVSNSEFDFTIITEAYVDDPQTETWILDYSELASNELIRKSIKIPPRCELYLELASDRSYCNYYFVDHRARGLFWLETLCSNLLGIPATHSASHLEMALERLYWVHIEYFPMHLTSRDEFTQFVSDLYNIISHGQADRLTSSTSTFPFTAEKCTYFLELLSRKRGQPVDGYTLCYAARLAETIAHQRFTTFHGQRCAQLDRLQKIYPENTPEQSSWLLSIANSFMWGIPQHYSDRLEELYLNEKVYEDQWTSFMSLCLGDWKNSLTWTLPLLIASILLANVRGGTVISSMPPVFSCVVGIASASCLQLRHQPLKNSSATDGVRYLQYAKSNVVGFAPSSIAFSLPRASYLWSIGLLTAQFTLVASHTVSKIVALLAASAVGTIILLVVYTIYPQDLSETVWSIASWCNSRMNTPGTHEDSVV